MLFHWPLSCQLSWEVSGYVAVAWATRLYYTLAACPVTARDQQYNSLLSVLRGCKYIRRKNSGLKSGIKGINSRFLIHFSPVNDSRISSFSPLKTVILFQLESKNETNQNKPNQQEENCILSMHSYVKNVLFTFVKQTENLQTQLTWDSLTAFLMKDL